MKLGSHNSMSYSAPKKWYMWPFHFMAKCQSKTIKEQYENYGVKMFDLRIKFNSKGDACFAHGIMEYKESIEDTLKYINSLGEIPVRILLENKEGEHEQFFREWCKKAKRKYSNIKFFGGRNKYSWKVIYDFKYKGPEYLDKYSSNNTQDEKVTGTYLDDWCPWIYAKLNNKKNIEKGTDKEYLLIDFVNIQ